MKNLVACFVFLVFVACKGGPPSELFPPLVAAGPTSGQSQFSGAEAVRAVLDRAAVPYSDFSIIETDAGPLIGFSVPPDGAKALSSMDAGTWRALGASLVFCGEENCLREVKEHLVRESASVLKTIERSEQLSLTRWATERIASDRSYASPDRRTDRSLRSQRYDAEAMWESVLKEPLKDLAVFILPAAESWKAPAYLMFGGWNECPAPEVQTAFAKYLQQQLGAEVVGVRFDVVRYSLSRPPSTNEDALRLAWESFLYCPDSVYQGVGTIEALAEILKGSGTIDFWWD